MKTLEAFLTAPGHFEFIEKELPPIGEDDILMQTVSMGLCHSDYPRFAGEIINENNYFGYPSPVPMKYPVVIGHEPVGIVVEVGKNVKRFRPGDTVTGIVRGAMRTYSLVKQADSKGIFPIPDMEKDFRYCIGEPLGCIVNLIKAASVNYGDYVAIVGCGFMGLMTLAGFQRSGAKELVAIDTQSEKLELASKYGATRVLNPNCQDVEKEAMEITKGHLFDVVVELSGSLQGLNTACSITKFTHCMGDNGSNYQRRGRLVWGSVYSKKEVFPVKLAYNLALRTPDMPAAYPSYSENLYDDTLEGILSYADGRLPLDEFVSHELPFQEAEKGFRWMENPPAGYIKGILLFDGI